jgi:hypothetical protein
LYYASRLNITIAIAATAMVSINISNAARIIWEAFAETRDNSCIQYGSVKNNKRACQRRTINNAPTSIAVFLLWVFILFDFIFLPMVVILASEAIAFKIQRSILGNDLKMHQ